MVISLQILVGPLSTQYCIIIILLFNREGDCAKLRETFTVFTFSCCSCYVLSHI